MKRKFVTNLALLLFLNLLVKPLYALGIDVGVQNAVGASEYGKYFILLNFVLIFQVILDLGIENFSRREIARHSHLLNKYFSLILPIKLMLGLLYFGICALVGYFMGWKAHEFSLLLVLLINQFLASFVLYFRANLGGMHMFRADSIISVIDRFVVIVICGLLLLDPVTRMVFRIEWLIYAQTAAYLISASIAFSMVFSKTEVIRFRIDRRYYRSIFRNSLPFALLFMLMAVYLRIDSVLLGKLLPDGKLQAGIYAQSFRIIEILSNYGYLFTIILLPIFSRMIKQQESVANLTRMSFTLLFVPAGILAFGIVSYRTEIIEVLYQYDLQHSSTVLGILIFSFLGMCVTYIFGTLLTANGSLRQLNTMAAIAVATNLVLNLMLIPRYGIVGAAVANALTQILTAIYQIFLATYIFRLHTDFRLIFRLFVFLTVIATGSHFIRQLPLFWVYSALLYLMFATLLAWSLGLLQLKSLLEILVNED